MNRRTGDRLVAALTIGLVLLGGVSALRAYRQLRTANGMMSDGMMPGMDPVWYLFGTIGAVSIVLGVYAVSREHLTSGRTAGGTTSDKSTASDQSTTETSVDPQERERISGTSALDMLPEDERRIIEPIRESPGLTQVELRGRSNFSKAKVSQTVSDLENRGLIYREKQGRTYRVYPGEPLKEYVSE